MKVEQKAIPYRFVPVSLTFETREELANFVNKQGDIAECDSGLTCAAWGDLDKHLNGFAKP